MFTPPFSPVTTIVIQPPEPLLFETRATGGYRNLMYYKDGKVLTSPKVYHFGEIYFINRTTIEDAGVYRVRFSNHLGQRRPADLTYIVVEPGT